MITETAFIHGFQVHKIFPPINESHAYLYEMEHSVLNGSKRFPVKAPFVELMKTEQLTIRQNTPDSQDKLRTIPLLKLSDIPKKTLELTTNKRTIDKINVLCHTVPTDGITYLNLYFSLDDLQEEELAFVSCLCGLLGNLDTDKYKNSELQSIIR